MILNLESVMRSIYYFHALTLRFLESLCAKIGNPPLHTDIEAIKQRRIACNSGFPLQLFHSLPSDSPAMVLDNDSFRVSAHNLSPACCKFSYRGMRIPKVQLLVVRTILAYCELSALFQMSDDMAWT